MQVIISLKEDHSGEKKIVWNLTDLVRNQSSVRIKMYDFDQGPYSWNQYSIIFKRKKNNKNPCPWSSVYNS